MGRFRDKAATLTRDEGAQSLVEFALLLPLLMYILMGIMQFGLVFNAYITLNNAVREGAREASLYLYDNGVSESVNNTNRQRRLVTNMVAARGILNMGTTYNQSTTNFAHDGTWSIDCPSSQDSCTTTDDDITVIYTRPTDVTSNQPKRGYRMEIEAGYHEAIFIPLIDVFLPDDPDKGNGWFRVPGRMTVIIN